VSCLQTLTAASWTPRIVIFWYPCATLMHASVLFMIVSFKLGMHANDDSKHTIDLHSSETVELNELALLTLWVHGNHERIAALKLCSLKCHDPVHMLLIDLHVFTIVTIYCRLIT
jgi:hypothetical protein